MSDLRRRWRASTISASLLLALLAIACDKAPASQEASSSGGSSASDVVARVGEKHITLDEVDQRAQKSNLSAFQQLYNVRREALEELVAEALLDEEAEKQGLTREELEAREIKSKVPEVTAQDVATFYTENAARLGGRTLDEIGDQIREFLAARHEAQTRESYLAKLREGVEVDVALEPPRVPIQVAEGERVKGNPNAPVTIVEYSDFQ